MLLVWLVMPETRVANGDAAADEPAAASPEQALDTGAPPLPASGQRMMDTIRTLNEARQQIQQSIFDLFKGCHSASGSPMRADGAAGRAAPASRT